MNLWIRTQDKKALTKVENIQVLEVHDGRWILISFNKESEDVTLDVYESEEKALKILDDIQNKLSSNIVVDLYAKFGDFEHCNKEGYALTPVYLMPFE